METVTNYCPILLPVTNERVTIEQEFCLTQAIGTMGAYSERDGIPNCSDEWLLTDLLRTVLFLSVLYNIFFDSNAAIRGGALTVTFWATWVLLK